MQADTVKMAIKKLTDTLEKTHASSLEEVFC